MKENFIIVNCKVPSEAYQIASKLRNDPKGKGFKITHGVIVSNDAGKISVKEGYTGLPLEDIDLTDSEIGGLVGALSGPLSDQVGDIINSFADDYIGKKKLEENTEFMELVSEYVADGDTALLLLAEEKKKSVLDELLTDFQVSLTRMEADEVAAELKKKKKETKRLRKAVEKATEDVAEEKQPETLDDVKQPQMSETENVEPLHMEQENKAMADTDGNCDKALEVKCNNGTFIGKAVDELVIWKGIPYATQPVGKLRWQKALPAADDDGVYDATKPGHIPIGLANDSEGTAEFGEDCLVLNVYCNTGCTDLKKPVMVWIHGGGFCAESQASPLYDLTNISRQYPDIIFVSIDYRLGFLGFMNFERVPGGENFKEAGNLGLLDQLEALRWVQKNIAAFGGDPDNVTIFGESAGSASVTFLPLIDGSEGLFKRIIAQSANIAYCDTMEHGIHVTQNFLSVTGCETMDELMALTTEQLVDAYAKAAMIDSNCLLGAANFPLLDGVTLPEDRAEMYGMWGDKKRAGIDMMIGSTQDEIRYFIPLQGGEEPFLDTLRWIAKRDRAMLGEQEKAMYDQFMDTLAGESEKDRLEQYCNDMNFRAGNTNMAIRHAAAGGNTYMYFIRKPQASPELGVMHSAEIPYLFDTVTSDPMGSGEIICNDECEFRHVAKEMWTNFARTGNPSTDKYEWKKFTGDDRQTMVFDDAIGMQKDIFGRREDLMMSWAERLGNGSSKRVC